MRNLSVEDRADAAEASRLRERRDHLLRTAGQDFALTDVAAQRRDLLVVSISDLLFPWQVINLPFMYEGIDETPGAAGTSGSIATAGLYAGGLGYGGMPEDSGTSQPYTEKWWIHNWYNSVVFPTSPYNGRLGWPVNESLPSGSLDLGGGVPVTGSIPVVGGRSAALGFIYGTIVSVASGYVQFLWGNFGTRRTVLPGTTVDYRDYDKIEYRFEPAWWLEAIDTRLELAR
jgi:hypothetical protein